MSLNLDVHGTLHIQHLIASETGHQAYSVVFKEYGCPPSEKKTLMFESIHDLKWFLQREVGASEGAFEQVMSDLDDRSGAEICDVVLLRDELNKLGL